MVLTFFGVIFNLVGILLVMRYGVGFQAQKPGMPEPRPPQNDEERAILQNIRRAGEFGIVILVLGAFLQILGIFYS
ncbi:hypothetical protein J2R99_001451 [Rhodopseudomonas julia]|uniref:Uncharacterized protein n=1 Tax=Rhodopseudomonas julia TaxID=200617 RepID=A0ABU0C514_9BRAD|nr:hypothetical protein [Rhodopseudomonas julia]MDQ0325602.1 hypothetical protein [Rhodopseudomonas julia]